MLKPNIVFFGEKVSDNFESHMRQDLESGACDLVLVIGTSLKVADCSLRLSLTLTLPLANPNPNLTYEGRWFGAGAVEAAGFAGCSQSACEP